MRSELADARDRWSHDVDDDGEIHVNLLVTLSVETAAILRAEAAGSDRPMSDIVEESLRLRRESFDAEDIAELRANVSDPVVVNDVVAMLDLLTNESDGGPVVIFGEDGRDPFAEAITIRLSWFGALSVDDQRRCAKALGEALAAPADPVRANGPQPGEQQPQTPSHRPKILELGQPVTLLPPPSP